MDKKIIKTSKAPAPIGAYNQAVLANETLYVSGQIAINPDSGDLIQSDIQRETKQVMENLGAVLGEAGVDFSNLVKCSIFLDDIRDFKVVNEVYAGYFDEATAPAREVIQAARLPKGAHIEISGIAVR